jgi:hypothetical protein
MAPQDGGPARCGEITKAIINRMSRRQRDFGALLAAVAGFLAGFLTLARGGANYFGLTQISGTQAQLFGWASIGFSIVIFLVYIRGSKRG